MKKILIVIALMLFTTLAYGVTVDTNATGNSVLIDHLSPRVVTFNTAMNRLLVVNRSSAFDIHVTVGKKGISWNENFDTYTLPTNVTTSTSAVIVIEPSASWSGDISTQFMGLYSEGNSHRIVYFATSDKFVE